MDRRRFLKAAGVVAGAWLAPQLTRVVAQG
ncbi:MAG: twin-arginine translocation signal domain-containing protein, partial [Meiothermus silvanus]|nr:twin-arginine translocation signal domain-containing protein [Allomeiothermus silvanus]